MTVTTPPSLELTELLEGADFEAKLAAGRDGKGELPASFFETYSAFANTDGGVVLLGLRETRQGGFEIAGIEEVSRVTKALWDGLNNRQRVSVNLLREQHVSVVVIDGKQVLRIDVPRAPRQMRPVFVGQNPLIGTYRRNYEGDYRASEDVVRRMTAEQIEDSRDTRILEHYGLKDLDADSLARYRQRYKVGYPNHPWNQLDDLGFLRSIGGWARDRDQGKEGLTAAGLLMFGQSVAICEVFPLFMLDYQEREDDDVTRWVDRLTPDGTWAGNLYEFYFRVIPKLVRDLRIPFRLEGDTRVDDTLVHRAVREALVNTIIHADYTDRVSLLVVKRPGGFEFRNPGTLRIPIEQAMQGGMSDGRNRVLQRMFRFIGLGEQAGSGLARIKAAWKEQQWRVPQLVEETCPHDLTRFTLTMASLLPAEAVTILEKRLGDTFRRANEIQKLALVTALIEERVTHARLREMTEAHSRDVTLALASLVQRHILDTGGAHKATYYFLTNEPPASRAKSKGTLITTEEHSEPTIQVDHSSQPSKSTIQVDHLSQSSKVDRLLTAIRDESRSREEIQALLGLKSAMHFRAAYLSPAIEQGLVELTIPEKPKSRFQKYRLTAAGRAAWAAMKDVNDGTLPHSPSSRTNTL
jgi:predicted HTH transcriptional regulator